MAPLGARDEDRTELAAFREQQVGSHVPECLSEHVEAVVQCEPLGCREARHCGLVGHLAVGWNSCDPRKVLRGLDPRPDVLAHQRCADTQEQADQARNDQRQALTGEDGRLRQRRAVKFLEFERCNPDLAAPCPFNERVSRCLGRLLGKGAIRASRRDLDNACSLERLDGKWRDRASEQRTGLLLRRPRRRGVSVDRNDRVKRSEEDVGAVRIIEGLRSEGERRRRLVLRSYSLNGAEGRSDNSQDGRDEENSPSPENVKKIA